MAPRIAIIGGGPAGLTCARILQLHGLRVTVYESENSTESRSQGGSLDLHADSGLKAVIAAGLIEQFNAKARPEDDQMRILDKTGQVFLDVKPNDEAEGVEKRPEIDRAELRQILLEALDKGAIQWGRKLVKVEPTGDDESGSHMLVFEDGAREEADLVIGADGAWSKVRPVVSDKTPAYVGVTFVDCVIENIDERFPKLADVCGRGTSMMLSLERGILVQRNANGKVRVYVVVMVAEEWAKTEFAEAARTGGPASIRRLMLPFFQGWNPEILDFIHNCDDDPIWARPIYALPVDHRWSPKRGVTLVGDAAHVMSPFAGEGVNIAMLDAMELAMALGEAWKSDPSVDSLYDAIPAVEQIMFERGQRAASTAARNQILAFNERAPHDFSEMLVSLMTAGGPPQ